MTKELSVFERYPDYMVKDPKTFPKERIKELKKLTRTNVEIDGKKENRRVKVKSVSEESIEWSKEQNAWLFNCKAKLKIYDV